MSDRPSPSFKVFVFSFVLTNPFMIFCRKTLQTILAVATLAQSSLSSDYGLQVRRTNRHRNIHPTVPKAVCVHRSSACHTSHSATTTSIVHQTPTTVSAIPENASRLTPNGIKAGIAGGDAYPFLKDHIGWWYDW